MPFVDGDVLDRGDHVLVAGDVDRVGRLRHLQPERVGHRGDGAVRGVRIEGEAPAKEVVGVEQAQHQVGVGYGGARVPPRP